jgi:Flp pilus assembly protein TadG
MSGQATLEFALVAPALVAVCLGIVSGGWLLFNYEGVVDAARSAARAAVVETSLTVPTASGACESGAPVPIQTAAQRGATAVPVNQAPLCVSSLNPNQLVQAPPAAAAADITLTCQPSLAAGDCQEITVAVALTVDPPFPIPGPVELAAQTTVAGPAAS